MGICLKNEGQKNQGGWKSWAITIAMMGITEERMQSVVDDDYDDYHDDKDCK